MHAWSFSSMKTFMTCPFRYCAEKVEKLYKFQDTKHTIYGKEVHTAAEDYLGPKAIELKPGYEQFRKGLDALGAIPGERICELKMALTKDRKPCKFLAKDVWCRGIADLVILHEDGETAYIVDYKTGKAGYPDKEQLVLMALMLFEYYPHIKKVKAALWFMVHDVVIKATYGAQDKASFWKGWESKSARLEVAFDTGVWNKKPNGLCRNWCPVEHCEYCGG